MEDGEAGIVVSGHGANLALPPLPLTTPVIVQLSNTETGTCWEASYDTPKTNDSERFKSASE
jgi:hypothetical protein